MTPEYLEHLAERVDPGNLWRVLWHETEDFTEDQRMTRDTAVALRRYARLIRNGSPA